MLRTGWFSLAVLLADLVWLCLAYAAAMVLTHARPGLEGLPDVLLGGSGALPVMFLLPGWLLFLQRQAYYDPSRTFTAVRSAQGLTTATLGALVLAMAIQWARPDAVLPRAPLYAWLGIGWVTLGAWRWSLLRASRRFPLPLRRQRVAIVGTGEEASTMASRLAREGRAAFEHIGFIRVPDEPNPKVSDSAVLGGVGALRELVNAHHVDTIVLASPGVPRAEALELATRCHAMGLRVLQAPFNWGLVSPRLGFAQLGNLQLIDLTTFGYTGVARWMKRAIDIAFVSVALVAVAPVLALTAIAVKLDSPGPALFTAPRVGKGGRSFPFIKFRSMVAGANKKKDALRSANESDGALFKIRRDPRITRVGRFIRRWSVDELPQFLNVLRGDMNLVGPRPLPIEDLRGIEGDPEIAYWFELRHQVRPGITGLWQVRGRSSVSFQEMVGMDIYYVQSWSLWLDLKILLMTVPAVLRGRGAS